MRKRSTALLAVAGVALAAIGGYALGSDGPAPAGDRSERPAPPPRPKPRLAVTLSNTEVLVGRQVRVYGELTSHPGGVRGKRLHLYADPYPFGDPVRVGSKRVRPAGTATFRVRPRRNTEYSVGVRGRDAARSQPAVVYANPRPEVSATTVSASAARLRFVVSFPTDLKPLRPRVFFYYAPGDTTRLTRVASARAKPEGRGRVVAEATITVGTSVTSFSYGACNKTRVARGLGEDALLEPACGQRKLTFAR